MDTCEIFDIGRSPLHREARVEPETFPALSVNDRTRRKLQRHHTFASRSKFVVPEPGNEYDYRRTPEGRNKRQTPTMLRPSIPADTHTRYAIEAYRAEDYSPAVHHYRRESNETPRCGTPMPQGFPTQTAWDNATNKDLLAGTEIDIPDNFFTDYSVPRPSFMAPKSRHSRKRQDIIVSDLEDEGIIPQTPVSPLNLTESVINYYFQRKVDKDKRILKWLVDCEEKSSSTSLPAHLPDISATRKNIPVSP